MHDFNDCTCCRHWRVVEQPSRLDVEERLQAEAAGKVTRLPFLPLLPVYSHVVHGPLARIGGP